MCVVKYIVYSNYWSGLWIYQLSGCSFFNKNGILVLFTVLWLKTIAINIMILNTSFNSVITCLFLRAVSWEKFISSLITYRFDPGASFTRDAVTFESAESFVSLPHQLFEPNSVHFGLSFAFKTRQDSGLILYRLYTKLYCDILCFLQWIEHL